MAIDYKLIGKRIKEHRRQNNMTQEQLAELADVTVGYISHIERGICKVNLDTMSVIAGSLNCDIADFITGISTLHKSYLNGDILSETSGLTQKQKQMVLDFIDIIKKYNIQ